ncbi:sporulation protein [Metabacillus schmidteae]|uniref:sporulation protein n=1 Tax=Metabacillus schmidteae TaxID=2730405 RepID=UPI00158DA644|nr:sporulation protein [Metabacillus schmidteae]
MSFFNKMLASVGIGSAKVDAKLSGSTIRVGEKVEGIIEVKGGNIEQSIDELYLTVNTNYEKEENDRVVHKEAVIANIKLNEPFVIMPGETKTIPFTFELPLDTPITMGSSKVWLQTEADIKGSLDPSDRDIVIIDPHILVDKTLKALNDLGFSLRKVKNEAASYKVRKRLPFVQEFEFVPTTGQFNKKLDEVEIMFSPLNESNIEIFLEVDRKARGIGGLFSEALDLDESMVKFTLHENELGNIKEILQDILYKHS